MSLTHQEALRLTNTPTTCQGDLKFDRTGFWSDVNWRIFRCADCGREIDTVGGAAHNWNKEQAMDWQDFDRLIQEGSVDLYDWNNVIKGNGSKPEAALYNALMEAVRTDDSDRVKSLCTIMVEAMRMAAFYKRSDSDAAYRLLQVLEQAEQWVDKDLQPNHYPDWFYEAQRLTQGVHPRHKVAERATIIPLPKQGDWLCVNSDRADSWRHFDLFNLPQGRHYSFYFQTGDYMPPDLRLDITSAETAHGEYGGGINLRDQAAEAFWTALSNHPTVDAATQEWMLQGITDYHHTMEGNTERPTREEI